MAWGQELPMPPFLVQLNIRSLRKEKTKTNSGLSISLEGGIQLLVMIPLIDRFKSQIDLVVLQL